MQGKFSQQLQYIKKWYDYNVKKHIKKAFEFRRVRFLSIGAINTVIDFVALNILVIGFGVPKIPANIMSVSVAMTFSFFANRHIVFKSQNKSKTQALKFVAITVFGLYVIQTSVIYFLTEVWHWPLDVAYEIIQAIGLGGVFSHEFVVVNGAKVIATIFTLVWNYTLYKKVVFNDQK